MLAGVHFDSVDQSVLGTLFDRLVQSVLDSERRTKARWPPTGSVSRCRVQKFCPVRVMETPKRARRDQARKIGGDYVARGAGLGKMCASSHHS